MRSFKNISIKVKLPLILGAHVLVALIVFGVMSYQTAEGIIKNKSISYTIDILNAIKLRLNDYVNGLKLISEDIMYDKNIYNLLNNASANGDALLAYEKTNRIDNIFKRIILTRTEIESISLQLDDGAIFFADYNGGRTGARAHYPMEEIRQKARQQRGKPIWYLAGGDDGGVERVFFARSVYRQSDLSEAGLLVFLIKKEFFQTLHQGLSIKDVNISIVSEKGEVIIGSDVDSSYEYDSEFLSIARHNSGSILDRKHDMILSYVSLSNPDWRIVSTVELNNLFSDIYVLRNLLIVLGVIVVLALLASGLLASLDIISPINKLTAAMKLSRDDHELNTVIINRTDELGILADKFNEMSNRINYLMKWVYKEQLTRNQAQLKALQAQINPHFMFNTLEAINWMAQLSGAPQISEVIASLAQLMEAGIGRDDRLITFDEELKYVSHFIKIMKFRYMDAFEFVIQADEDARNVKVPRLLVQPLIENAIYHGLKKKQSGGEIKLSAVCKESEIRIEVRDNGMGLDQSQLESIRKKLLMTDDEYFSDTANNKDKSIGIENVNRRIKLFYGPQYGLSIQSNKNEYFLATIRMPIE